MSASDARELLRMAATVRGFAASAAWDHYQAVWTRDAAVACLGADTVDDAELRRAIRATLRTLAAHTPPSGRVPAVVWPDGSADWGEAGAVDAPSWFVIALEHHVAATDDDAVAAELWPTALAAISWLGSQDVTGWGAIESPAAADWMDSSLTRSGQVFHVNVLYAWALRSAARLAVRMGIDPPADPDATARAVNALFWPETGTDLGSLVHGTPPREFPHPLARDLYRAAARPDRRHYLAAVSYGHAVDRCDVLANVLAVVSGLAGPRAGAVLDTLDALDVAEPYPSRTWPAPIPPDDPDRLLDPVADARQDPRWRNPPGAYHNGGVWPYIGAFHAAALAIAGRSDAAAMLDGVAAANRLGDGFPEWIHATTGMPGGAPLQTWNAGAYLWARDRITG